MYPESPQPGDVVQVDGDASVQFQGDRSMTFRVTRVDPRSTYDGWLWLEGHVLGPAGNALQRRRIFVRQEGLHAAGQALGR
ncbi:hypothetical protein [Actinoplanes sp. NPDC051411]|uniref:hypothetical protein n=1 Tax=Actinoplanes sp. NPDC051411 TaxID=3155522 RepID=UPI0034285106